MKPLYILVAEDNKGDVLLFQEALQHHQVEHKLRVVGDGQAALDYISRIGRDPEALRPDVLLLDLNLPRAEGTTILSELRKNPHCIGTPVIVVTSSDAERDRLSVAAYHPIRYFRKPSDFDEYMKLGAIIREAVEGGQSG